MGELVLLIVAAAWAAVLLPPLLPARTATVSVMSPEDGLGSFTSDGGDSIEGPARFARETNSDGADTFLTRLNLLDEPLADALLLRVGRLEAVLERVADLLHGELLLLRVELVEQ